MYRRIYLASRSSLQRPDRRRDPHPPKGTCLVRFHCSPEAAHSDLPLPRRPHQDPIRKPLNCSRQDPTTHRAKVPLQARSPGERRDWHPIPPSEQYHLLHLFRALHPDHDGRPLRVVIAPIADTMYLQILPVRAYSIGIPFPRPHLLQFPDSQRIILFRAVARLIRFLF